jgi:hypothetical protein
MSWTDWASGVLAGVSAPVNATNLDTLWAWSNKESGANVMRWNNPLNTTQPWPGSSDMNSVGVKFYATVSDGIAATVTTLLNGYYPVILANLRGSVPRAQWGNACGNLGTWGTGCNWLQQNYGAAPGQLGEDVTDADLITAHDAIQFRVWGIIDTSAQSYADFNFAVKSGKSLQSIEDGWKANPQAAKWTAELATIGKPVVTPPATVDLAPVLTAVGTVEAIVTRIENALKGGYPAA